MTLRNDLLLIVAAWSKGECGISTVRDSAEQILLRGDHEIDSASSGDPMAIEVLTLLANAHVNCVIDADAESVVRFLRSAGVEEDWSTWREYWNAVDFDRRRRECDDLLKG